MKLKVAFVLAGAAVAALAAADTPAVTLSSPIDAETSDVLLGWTFTTSQTLSVTALGYYTDGNQFLTSHDLAILVYNTGVVVASGTVGTSATDDNDFRYTASSGTLNPGTRYIVVGTDTSDPWSASPEFTTPTFASPIHPDGDSYYDYGMNSIEVPPNQFIYAQYFGPTFKFASVSTPGPCAGLALVISGLSALRRRRRS